MIGKNQIVIDSTEFLKGMTTTVDTQDGGFSPETVLCNLIAEPGVINAQTDAADGDSDVVLTGEIIASCPDPAVADTNYRIVVTDDAKYYAYNGTKLGAVIDTDATAGVVYSEGVTDMITFNGKVYTTNDDYVTELTLPATLNKTYHAFASGAVLHPAVVFENNAYYGDGNLLKRQTPTTTPATILTLATGHYISALGIDPGTGKMLIATTEVLNWTNVLPKVNKIMWYDGYSNKVIKSIIVEDLVTAFYHVAGIVYVGYGQNLGYLTGSGITFLRKLTNVTLVKAELPYKHHFANLGRTLCVVNGREVLAFGEIEPGRKIFHNIWYNSLDTNKIRAIFDAGQHKLGISKDTTKFYTYDITDLTPVVSGGVYFYSKRYEFPRPVFIRRVRVFFKTAIAAAATAGICAVSIVDDTGTTTSLGAISSDADNAQKVVETPVSNFKTSSLQIRHTMAPATSTLIHGVLKFIIYYDVAE